MDSLVDSKEKTYYALSLVISIMAYIAIIISMVGILYVLVAVAIGIVIKGLFLGHIKGNGIKITQKQFPDIYKLSVEIAVKMDIKIVPDVYVIESGGMINAFATRFSNKDFVVIYSDVLELAYEKGKDALSFIIAHEFAHIKRKHITKHMIISPASLIPFLNTAYSRACEYTCDRFASHYYPEGAISGLLVLAAGKKLYKNVNYEVFIHQSVTENDFWVWYSEILSTHPNTPKRIRRLTEAGISSISLLKPSLSIEPSL